MLNLVVGPFPALERELADALRRLRPPAAAGALPSLAPVAVLAPSRRLLAHLERSLARDHGLVLANVEFETFQSFARRMLVEDGVPATRFAERPAVEERILERALDRLPDGHPLRPIRGAPGLLGSLLSTVRDLDEARVDSAALENDELAAAAPGGPGLAIVAPLLAALEGERSRLGLLNRAGVVAAAAEAAPKSKWLAAHAAVLHYGAYDLTQHQLDWLSAMAGAVGTTVFFPGDHDREGVLHPAFRFAEPALSAVRRMAGDERWINAPPPPAATGMIEAGDPAEEYELIAEEIRRLVSRDGLAPSDIVVVARGLDGPASLVAAAFARAGVPWETPQGTALPGLPAGRGLIALARALAGEGSPGVAVELVSLDWLTVFPKEARSMARASALARRLPPFARSADWTAMADADDAERRKADIALARAVAKGLATLEGAAARFPSSSSWKGFVQLWTGILEALVPDPGPAEDVINAGLEAVEDLRVLEPVEPEVAAASFHARVVRALEGATVQLRSRGGGIRVLSAMDARGVRPRVLFLTGANDGDFPRVTHEDPFLRDAERRALNDPLGFKIQTKREEGGAEERLLFRLLAEAPVSRLYLTWHAEDGSGRRVYPSPLVVAMAGSGDGWIREARKTAAELRGISLAGALGAADPAAAGRSAGVVRELDLPAGEGPTDRDGFPAAPGFRPDRLRVTELRDMAGCPYKVHARSALRIEAVRGPRSWWEPEAWRLGNVIHAAMCTGLQAVLKGGKKAGIPAAASAATGEALASEMPSLGRLPVLGDSVRDGLVALVATALESEVEWLAGTGMTPALYEKREEKPFGAAGTVLRFQADRLDASETESHVTDYKSHGGRPKFPVNAKLDPAMLQASLYFHLLAPDRDPRLTVLHLGTGMVPPVQPVRAEGERGAAVYGAAIELALLLDRAWHDFRASPWPDELLLRPTAWRPECRFCEFRTGCRADHDPTVARLAVSPELKALREGIPSTSRNSAAGVPAVEE